MRHYTRITHVDGSTFLTDHRPMPAASKTLVDLEQRLVERLLDFERLDEAWPRGCTVIERAEIGRQRGDVLSGIEALAAPATGEKTEQI